MIDLVHRTVFVHVPKCGGQSIEAAFCDALGLDWHHHRYLLALMERPKSWPGRHGRLAHLRAEEYLSGRYMPVAQWAAFYTFGLVRNPYHRVESAWRYLDPVPDFPDFIAQLAGEGLPLRGFLDPALDYLADEYGGLLVNEVWKLEDMPARWPELAERAGIPGTPLPHLNKGGDTQCAVWTPAAVDAVRAIYAKDFSAFGYDPEAAPI